MLRPSPRFRFRPGSRPRLRCRPRPAAVLVFVAAALILSGCQLRVAVDARVERDGRGTLTVGVGLDAAARARVGDLDRQVRVGDLTAAGWQVGRAEEGPDGMTWLRATREFSSIEELNRALADITGDPQVLRDFRLEREESGTSVFHRLTGTVDAARARAALTDPELGARMGGDPVAAHVAAVEREEGRPVADLVGIEVSASVAGEEARTWRPRLDDAQPTRIDVTQRETRSLSSLASGGPLAAMALAGVAVVTVLATIRRRLRRRRRRSWY